MRYLLNIAAAATLAIVAACTTAGPQGGATQQDFDPVAATRVFGTGYADIRDIYIEDVEIGDLAEAGLASLSEIDPNVRVIRTDGQMWINVAGRPVGKFRAPKGGSGGTWGSITAAALNATRASSPTLSDAEAERLYQTVFDGILTKLDDYSRYAGRDEARRNRANRDGFHGIGVRIEMVDHGVRVVSVMERTPAEAAGVQPEDVIIAIDGQSAAGIDLREAVDRLRGPLNSEVLLKLERPGRDTPLAAVVKRRHIVPQTVIYRTEGDAAYIRITSFNQDTTRSLRQKLSRAQHELGSDLSGYIIDLRGNPGGLLDQAVSVADVFVREGSIVSTHGRHPDSHQYFDAESDDLANGRPMVVLINGRSASASEIVAAAVQDARRGIVIGSASYGKGTVQTVLRLPNDGELTLTWARFHAPSGYALHLRGVMPNVCTSPEIVDGVKLLNEVKAGRLPRQPGLTLAQSVSTTDVAQADNIRDGCPPTTELRDADIEIAKSLLANPVLYRMALARPNDQRMANAGFKEN